MQKENNLHKKNFCIVLLIQKLFVNQSKIRLTHFVVRLSLSKPGYLKLTRLRQAQTDNFRN